MHGARLEHAWVIELSMIGHGVRRLASHGRVLNRLMSGGLMLLGLCEAGVLLSLRRRTRSARDRGLGHGRRCRRCACGRMLLRGLRCGVGV